MALKKNYSLGILFALVNMVGLGVVGLIDKLGTMQTANPFIFSVQSLFFSFSFTFIFSLFFFRNSFIQKLNKISFKSALLIIFIGLSASGLFILFRFLGLTHSTGTFATLSQVIGTSITAILAYIFLKEHLSKQFWFLFFIIIIAMYFVSIGEIAFATIKPGDLYILSGTIFLATGNILSKIVVPHVSPFLITLGRFFVGFIFLFFISLLVLGNTPNIYHTTIFAVISGFLWSLMIISFNYAIQRIGVTVTTSLLMVSPIITMILESYLLKYSFSAIQILGVLMVILFGILIVWQNRNK